MDRDEPLAAAPRPRGSARFPVGPPLRSDHLLGGRERIAESSEGAFGPELASNPRLSRSLWPNNSSFFFLPLRRFPFTVGRRHNRSQGSGVRSKRATTTTRCGESD